MKKLMISLLAIAATMNLAAINYNTKATITLTSADKLSSCSITIGESDDLTEILTNGYYGVLNEEGRKLALYVVYNGVKYQDFVTKSLSDIDVELGIMTPGTSNDDDQEYTITVSKVKMAEGKTLSFRLGDQTIKIVDAVTPIPETTVKLPSGVPYYDSEKPETKKTYGVINPAPVVPGICHQNGKLEFTGYKDAQFKVVDYNTGAEVRGFTLITSDETQAFDAPAADEKETKQYKVIIKTADEKEETLVIAVLKK